MDTERPVQSPKLFAFLATIGALTIAANWYLRFASDRYYVKLAVIGPVALVIGCFFLLFPKFAGKSDGNSAKSAVQVAAVVVALGCGAANWWLLSRV